MTTENQTPTSEQLTTADVAAAAERRAEQRAEGVELKPADRPAADRQRTPLFASDDAESLRSKWSDIQAGFVDEPRQAVEQADGLVADVMQRLATVFANERRTLEQQWDRGTDTNTEELRQALQRYRSFFDRLLAL